MRACLFLGLVLLVAVTASTGRGIPYFQSYGQHKGIEYFAGFVVAFYVLSAIVLAGKIVVLLILFKWLL